MARASAFCAPPDPTPRLGALGILSTAESRWRHGARKTLMEGSKEREAGGGLAVRFVVRAAALPDDLRREQSQSHDIVLVEAATLNRRSGPLVSLLLWYDCALQAWPAATFIGKADEDVYIHLPGVELHLRQTLSAVQDRLASAQSPPRILWGVQESYSWDTQTNLPRGFQYLFGYKEDVDCSRTRNRVGPFHFAKGPLFFVSTPLVRQLRRSNDARSLAEAAIATANRSHDESLLPWEDVLNGLALAVSSTTRGNNNAIHAIHVGETPFGSGVFIEPHSSRVPGDYLALAPSTLLLHEKYKHHNRIGIAHRWLGRHHCAPKRIELSCLPHTYLSCAGGKWARCYTTDAPYVEAGCSTNLTKLSGGFSADANEPSATLPSSESCKQRMQPQGWGRWKLPQSSSEPPSTKLQGTCAETEFGEGDCEGGMSGAWVVRGALGDCLKLCECCARCRFASFSKANSDCSWFAECNTSSLLRSGPARGYQTVEMPGRGHVK